MTRRNYRLVLAFISFAVIFTTCSALINQALNH